MNYPTDRKSCGYAIRFIKVLLNSDAIRDFGTEPVMLAIFIASREDRLHYSKPPRFWRAELMDKFGKGSPKDFLRIRNEAVEAGLLFHKEGTKKTPGLYWTLVPDWLLPRFEAFPKRNGIKSTRSQNGTEKGTESGTEKGTHSIPITHTPNKDTASLDFSNEDIQTAKWMFGLIQCIHPSHKPPSFEKWAGNIRLMRERDSRTDSEIRRLFAAANSHSFWQTNILGPDKLRKQWDKLIIALKATSPKKSEEYPDLTPRKRTC